MDLKDLANVPNVSKNQAPLILVVEDDEDNQLLLAHAMTMFGWKYKLAVDGIKIMSLVKKQPPSLILLDIILPNISGLQIAIKLKSQPATKNIPLIAVTGLTAKQDLNSIFAAGFNDYVCKPFYLEQLDKAIAMQLNLTPSSQLT